MNFLRLVRTSSSVKQLVLKYKKWAIATICLLVASPILAIIAAYAIIEPNTKFIRTSDTMPHERVGIVLGAGVNKQGKPYKELKARLDIAAEAYRKGKVEKLIMSGDNRFKNYNEPDAMMQYMINEKHIPKADLQPDYAGRSTYESCERASRIFGLKQTTIFSAESHLPRAIYLCRHFGIESHGVAANLEANNSTRREALARVKALYNVYLRGEHTVLGPQITVK